MQGRIITSVAVVAFAPQAAAGELDDAFLRGSQAPAPIYRIGARAAAPAAFEELLLIRPLTHRLLETLASRQRLALGTARTEYRRRGDVSGLTLGAPSEG